jgi:hypothetical protein
MMNSEGLDRFGSVLVKIFGKHYLKKLEGKELDREWNNVFVQHDEPIRTDEELASYIRDVGRPHFNKAGLQWRVFLVKNYKDTSLLLFKLNHFLSDGIGSMLIAASLQENGKPKPAQLPYIRDISNKDKLLKSASLVNMPLRLYQEASEVGIASHHNIK